MDIFKVSTLRPKALNKRNITYIKDTEMNVISNLAKR